MSQKISSCINFVLHRLLPLLIVVILFSPKVYASDDSLVASYNFDEGHGKIVYDSSGNKNNGRIKNPIWRKEGKFGGALEFGDHDNIVVIPDSDSLDLTDGMTISAWVKPKESSTSWTTIALKENGSQLSYALYAKCSGRRSCGMIYSKGAERQVKGSSNISSFS